MKEEVFDIAIVGGGIVGSATFYQLQKAFPTKKLVLIEKESKLAHHQTGNNSGVIHSGLYYTPVQKRLKIVSMVDMSWSNLLKNMESIMIFVVK